MKADSIALRAKNVENSRLDVSILVKSFLARRFTDASENSVLEDLSLYFLTPFQMINIENTIKVRRPLYSSFHKFAIDVGAIFDLRELKHNHTMVKFLCEEHTEDPYVIVGNIGELYRIRDKILKKEKIARMTYRQYLEAKVRGEL